ncbi:SDR family NAD(P)-dependent oxidoreductase [Ruegeria sp. 2012CJ41-6]|uniref:SDR family NAD(P)-dependent oxidoreductase n=1 Tax=Ruegeria spongiae TaxID=2942209 RepID=A0ABT0Q5Z8_9RHOB|nr:SDR family NAD(P)-dependent oxidoreductase [Ruegeria spongiae]MCL6285306.1 SDR family NAD(P)-dependent oxidoreductase [Ruegeria spongiae]
MHVVITGANRGIGRALADRYRAAGHDVTGTARDGSEAILLDVTNPENHARMAEALAGREIDLLICNAGVYLDKGCGFDAYHSDLWAQTFAANVTGVFLTVQTLLPNLRAAGGRIAVLSSIMASHTRAPGGSYVYRASKAAVLNLGRNLATDLGPQGIAVGIYHPGWVRTDMGGAGADLHVDEATSGLVDRFDTLSLATTGCFESWDGAPIAY